MAQRRIISRYNFAIALKEYDSELTEKIGYNNLGVYTHSLLYEKANNLSDILFSNGNNTLQETFEELKENISLAFSHQKIKNLREVKEGVAIISYKGIHFFILKLKSVYINEYGDKMYKLSIIHHYFFPFEQLSEIKPGIKKKILFQKCFTIQNIYSDNPNEDFYNYNLSLDYKPSPFDISNSLYLAEFKIAFVILVIAIVTPFIVASCL